MTKQSGLKGTGLPAGSAGGGNAPSLAELRALRQSQRATSQRVEELKLRLFRFTEQHMDQVVRQIRRWLEDARKNGNK